MKIAINAVSAKMGGAVTYLTNLLCCLPPPESTLEFVVFLPPATAERLKKVAPNIQLVPTAIGYARWWQRLWWEQITLRRLLKKHRAGALFSTANFAMFRCPVRQMLLVRIRLYFSKTYLETFLPKYVFKSRVAFRLRRWLCCQSVRWADLVMTPTQAMMDELRVYADVPPAKALVNFYGVAQTAGDRPPRPPSEETPSRVRLLYVSLYAEHKNLTDLLQALPLLNRDGNRKFELVTTVNPGWEGASWTSTHKGDIKLSRRRDIAPWVKFMDPLQPEEIRELYRCADIFVFPSLTESFGHPMVEAMAHGLPVVASDTPINREICGEGAVYYSLSSPEDLAARVLCLASNAGLRAKLATAGRERAASRFQWETHAQHLMDAFIGRDAGIGVWQHTTPASRVLRRRKLGDIAS